MVTIGINGFGRIGRAVFKIAFEKGIKVVAINDIHGAEVAAYLLKHDSIYGRYAREVSFKGDELIVDTREKSKISPGSHQIHTNSKDLVIGQRIKVLSEREPEKLPWKKLGVDVVVESTGVFRDKEGAGKHLKAGAKYVLITAPSDDCDVTIVPGVNSGKLKKEHKIISVASCTTNCLCPMLKVLNEKFGIKRALMTTAHAYTNDQSLHDEFHKKLRRGRAAALNIVPTSSGATEAVDAVMPELKGKVNGLALRVPVACGSMTDLVAELGGKFDVASVNEAFRKASLGELNGILEFSEEELVSSDIVGNPHSCIFDSKLTQVDGNLVKILGWYDNEFGYSNRVVDVVGMLKKFV